MKMSKRNMMPDMDTFAAQWIEAWNSHDLDHILSHYAEDVEVTSPMIKVALGIDDGTLHGKDAAGIYWAAALQKVPDLQFELVEATQSVDSIALYYKSAMGKMAIEIMYFTDEGKVSKVVAYYN